MLARMRLDGVTETAVPFAERVVLLWRRGAPTPDMSVDVLVDVLQVRWISVPVLRRRVRPLRGVPASPCQRGRCDEGGTLPTVVSLI